MTAHGSIVVVHLLPDTFPLAEGASEVLLLLLVVVSQQFLPVGGVSMLRLLLQHLCLRLLLLLYKYANKYYIICVVYKTSFKKQSNL